MFQMNKLGCDDEKAIEKLRMRLKHVLKPNMYEDTLMLYRFLKARDFNLDEAEDMLRKHLFWRKLFQVDNILEDFEPKEFFRKYAEPSFIGFDKDECLVIYCAGGKIEMTDVLNCVKMNGYYKHWIWFAEKIRSAALPQIEKNGWKASQASFIMDLDKLTLRNATNTASAEHILKIMKMLQNNYPECMKAIYVINAPAYYTYIYTVIKTIMSNAMIRKIHVFGHIGWKERFLEVIDADVLPAFLGGNRTDPDGDALCRAFVNHGGKIPSVYFLSDEERYFKDRTRVTTILVPNMKKEEICVDVKALGSLIQWAFYTKRDVGFGLFYQTVEGELEEVIPIVRYDTSDGMEKDSYKVRSIGKYVIVFENTHSWLSSKEVEYCIEVVNREV